MLRKLKIYKKLWLMPSIGTIAICAAGLPGHSIPATNNDLLVLTKLGQNVKNRSHNSYRKLPVSLENSQSPKDRGVENDSEPPSLVVTTTADVIADDGQTSIREAINHANILSGAKTISFRIPTTDAGFSGGVFTIKPTSPLPAITSNSTAIDGGTQTTFGGDTNTAGPEIVLNGSLGGPTGQGLNINASNCLIKSLVVNGNATTGISIFGAAATNNRVEGCYIGTNSAGSAAVANGTGIAIGDGIASNNASFNTIGGTSISARNIISGNTLVGISISGTGGANNLVQGNYIGTDASGNVALANGQSGVSGGGGVVVAGNNTIGGTVSGSGNVISGNQKTDSNGIYGSGILIKGSGSVVQGNSIGTNAAGTQPLPNTYGVLISNGSNSLIGGTTLNARNVISGNFIGIEISPGTNNLVQGNYIGTNAAGTGQVSNRTGIYLSTLAQETNAIGGTIAGAGNRIAFNTRDGIVVAYSTRKTSIRGNSIYSNGLLGINLNTNNDSDGVTANDLQDGDTGSNDLQNYPVLTAVNSNSGTTTVTGTLNSMPSRTFELDFFSNAVADANGYGEGQTYLTVANTTLTTDANGNASFNLSLSGNYGGEYFTATATDTSTGDTSEFSAALLATPSVLPSLTVNNPISKPEGSASSPGSTVFAVRLSAASTQTVTINYQTANGVVNGAVAGSDYVAKSGSLTFAPGETVKTVTVNFLGDSIAELNETFFLDLRTPTNATIADSRGAAYIRNDDGPSMAIDNAVTVNEGNSGTTPQNFVVRLSASSTNTITVDWATTNNTAGPADYTVATGTLTFAPGETTKTITVLVKGDTSVEATETYRVNLLHQTYSVLADSQGIGYIRNDDVSALISDEGTPSK